MTVSRQSLEILLDLLEIKVNSIQIQDREDAKELNKLRKCRQELLSELTQTRDMPSEKLLNSVEFSKKSYKKPSYLGH